METVMEEEEEYLSQGELEYNQESDITQLCRVCANPNEYLIPIFQGEGLEHDLKDKIKEHLPIKVTQNDKLPKNLCYQCASTLIAWHDMVIGCLEADAKLKSLIEDDHSQTGESEVFENTSVNDTESQNIKYEENQTVVAAVGSQDTEKGYEFKPNVVFGAERVAMEEEVTSLEPEITEETILDERSLSFKNYQIALQALRLELLPIKTNQPKTSTQPMKSFSNKKLPQDKYSNERLITGEEVSDNTSDNKKNRSSISLKSQHKCNVCDRSFKRAYDLKRHDLVHLNIHLFENQDCHQPLSQNTHFGKETGMLKVSPMTLITFTCEVCSRTFKVKDSYERHKRIHTGERPFQCSECSKRFRDSGALTRHVKEVHAKIRNHPCNVCNKWFVNRATLEDHYRTHTGERPYVCHQCGIMFKSKAALYQHSKIHSNYLPHECVYCGKCFRRKQELIAHTPTHTNEKTHICEKCGKAFSTRSELQRHIVVHSDEKPFSCLSCGLNFSQKRYLKSHIKTRHGHTEDIQQ